MQWLTVKKALFCALRPRFWRHLSVGVAPAIEHCEALSRFSFQTIVDVGANRGQFTALSRWLFPNAAIHSFEPLSGPAKTFSSLFSADPQVSLFKVAVGAVSGAATIYVATRDDSSSLLKPADAQAEIFGVGTSRLENVAVRPLSACLESKQVAGPALLKIDVQGGELEVLKGSESLIHCFDAVYVECSYVSLYEEQPLYSDIARWADKHGFQLGGVYNQHVDRRIGPVQADFLFVRP